MTNRLKRARFFFLLGSSLFFIYAVAAVLMGETIAAYQYNAVNPGGWAALPRPVQAPPHW